MSRGQGLLLLAAGGGGGGAYSQIVRTRTSYETSCNCGERSYLDGRVQTSPEADQISSRIHRVDVVRPDQRAAPVTERDSRTKSSRLIGQITRYMFYRAKMRT